MNEKVVNKMTEQEMKTKYGKVIIDTYNFLKYLGLSGEELEKAILKFIGIVND